MADMTTDTKHAARLVQETASGPEARARRDALTGLLLFVASLAAGLLFVVETILGLLWAFDGKPPPVG
ncbi:MAG: hypothetical protein GY844_28240 [Bradyrhizobium sp.]|nr:hypothetical protein [Bradyrhizobium sp.]